MSGSHAGLCPYGVGFAFFIVQLIIIGFILTKRPLSRKFWVSLLAFFVILAVVDVPTTLGRCPGQPEIPIEVPEGVPSSPRGRLNGFGEGSRSSSPVSPSMGPLLYGFAAGLVSFTSPCGMPLVPAFILYYLGKKYTVRKGFYGGLTATFGIFVAFTFLGIVISGVSIPLQSFAYVFESLTVVVTIAMGILLVLNIRIPFLTAPRVKIRTQDSAFGLFMFGIAWGIAIIACSPYIFFPFVFYSVTLGFAGIQTYMTFALGLGLPILIISLLISIGKKGMVTKFTKLVPKLHKLSGIILINIGSSLLTYTYILRPLNVPFDRFTGFLLLLVVFVILNSMRYFMTPTESNSA